MLLVGHDLALYLLEAIALGSLKRVVVATMLHSLMLVVMGSMAKQAHAAKAAHPNFLANLRGGRMSGRFSCTHIGGELGEETADDRAALGIWPRGRSMKDVNDVELMILISPQTHTIITFICCLLLNWPP